MSLTGPCTMAGDNLSEVPGGGWLLRGRLARDHRRRALCAPAARRRHPRAARVRSTRRGGADGPPRPYRAGWPQEYAGYLAEPRNNGGVSEPVDGPAAKTFRLFLLGAGFSKPAGLPLASELLPLVLRVAASHFRSNGYSHLEHALEQYDSFVADVDPGQELDLEEFAAWLDWEHLLRLTGSDTFSQYGNQAGLQLRWAIGKVLHDATPESIPQVYLDFTRQLTTSDRVITLNYDLLLEFALETVGLPYRRFPSRYSEIYDTHAVGDTDQPSELIINKLHGSIDWTYPVTHHRGFQPNVHPLTEGPRPSNDPLLRVSVIEREDLSKYYEYQASWWSRPPLLMPPSRAKPLASSELVPLWDGVGLHAYMLGGFTVIGCSLPPGDPYVLQLVHSIATDYVAGRKQGENSWPQRRMKVVDLRETRDATEQLLARLRFFDDAHTDFVLDGFSPESLDDIFEPPDLLPRR